ncbi:MAG: VWA domain-containing protein [Deltaproteobacteria bacterium]|nr:VWA domain-containing protein [Deltaproteobacteria bacterium]
MLRTLSSFLVAAALSLAALILGPILDKLPPPPDPPPVPDVVPLPPPVPTSAYPSRASADGVLSLSGALSGSHVLVGADGSLTLVADVHASKLAAGAAPPLDLALVIDRSGSMAGPKLKAAKDAARSLIDRARPDDRVTLIAYGSTVTMLARGVPGTRSGKAELLAAVDRIEDFGGTFISGALEAAGRALQSGHPGRVKRLILLSDGEANEGVTSRRGLTRLAERLSGQGITISSVGFGVDFDEDTMLALADASGGRYAYVRGPADLSGVLGQELLDAGQTVAREILLRLRPRDGTTLETLYGYPSTRQDGEVWVRLRDLESEGHARVVATLRAPTGIPGGVPVVELTLQYQIADPATAARYAGGMATTAFTLGHTVVDDAELVERGRDREVLAAGARAYAAEALDQAARAYAEGRQREAQRVLRTRLEEVMLQNRATIGSADLSREFEALEAEADFDAAPAGSDRGRDMVKSMKARAVRMAR